MSAEEQGNWPNINPALLQSGYEVHVIGRNEEKVRTIFSNTVQATTWNRLNTLNPDEFTAIINLAGEDITAHRWNTRVKSSCFPVALNQQTNS